jgi:DNA processing protein
MPIDDELLALLTLSLVPGLGPRRLRALRARHGSARGAVRAAPGDWPALLAGRQGATLAARVDPQAGLREAERVTRVGAWLLSDADPRYPAHWCAFDELPPLLYVRGAWPAGLNAWPPAAVAVVGSRRVGAAAAAFAHELGRCLAHAGAVVVSGLAFGVDAAAHRGALAAGQAAAPTLAVLASGVDRPGPVANADLAQAILAAGGALISEAPLGYAPTRGDFPRRNRLVAALARAVVVAAAGPASGAQLTAGHAAAYGRDVLVCPARPWDDDMAGNLALLRDGATPLCSVAEAPGLLGFAAGPATAVDAGHPRHVPDDLAWAYQALTADPAPLELLLSRTGRGVGETLAALERLVALGVGEADGARRYRRR